MSEVQKQNIKELLDVAMELNTESQQTLLRLGKDLLFIDEVKNENSK